MGNTQVVKTILSTIDNEDVKKQVDVNKHGGEALYPTALHQACRCKGFTETLEVISSLLETLNHPDPERRIRLDEKNSKNQTALDVAKQFENAGDWKRQVYEMLLPHYNDLEN